jgi:hypothetical protein
MKPPLPDMTHQSEGGYLQPVVRPVAWCGIANTMEDSTGWIMHLSTDGGKSLCGLRLTECMDQRTPQDGDCMRCLKSYNRRWPNGELSDSRPL